MKHALMLSAAVAAALSLAACSKTGTNTATSSTTPAGEAQTSPNGTAGDTAANAASGAGAGANKAEDATGAAVGATSANTMGAHDTGAFVSNASQSDMYEIQAAQIAEKRSKNKAVQDFARMMVKDHTKSTAMMKPLIQAAGKMPADKLDNRRQGFIDHLNSASDADFDKTYIDQQVAAHKEALDLLQGYAKDGSDAGLKGGAANLAPTVQMHLDKARQIQGTLK